MRISLMSGGVIGPIARRRPGCKAYAGSVTARRRRTSLVPAKIEVNCFLKIVDNRRRLASTAAMPTLAATTPPHPTIALLQTSSLSSVVQAELERMILSGELRPGEKLTEMALASRLGVSRGPLREAFRMLDEAGLVRTEKNRGVFVRSLPVEEAMEIFDLRASMDELVGRRLAGSIPPADL